MTLLIQPTKPASHNPMDQIGKRILGRLANNVCFDVPAIAREVGASEDVVRHRIAAMQDGGILQGFAVRLNQSLLGQSYEFLVSGAPTHTTDKLAIGTLCMAADVTRVFGLASAHSVAFTIVGRDANATQARGLALAQQAGLRNPQAVLVLNTFQDRASSAFADALAVAPVAAAAPIAAPSMVEPLAAAPLVGTGLAPAHMDAEPVAA